VEVRTADWSGNTNVSSAVQKKELVHNEGTVRRRVYDKMLPMFPEGTVTTSDLSRNYSTQKKKYSENSPDKKEDGAAGQKRKGGAESEVETKRAKLDLAPE